MTSFEPPGSSGEELVVGVSVKVDLRGGLATVATTRTFRNPEGRPIEALLTFPAPPSARVFQMEAEFDGRTVRAQARVREDAEDAYELAATHGPLTIQLEEMQPGLLVLSLAEMQPDAEIAVTTVWAAALELDGGIGRLRIPLTIAEVGGKLGDPGLDEMFEPRAEASPGEAPVVIESRSGPVRIGSEVVIRAPGGGTFTGSVPDNAPLDLVVEGLLHGNLTVRAADGRTVSLGIAPATASGPMDAAVVVDASTSMDVSCGHGSRLSKWEAAKDALRTVFGGLGKGDPVEFWAFADRLASRPAPTPDGLGELGELGNGKEIAAALRDVSEGTGRADILLVTDGRRHVRAAELAGLGRRLFVVLVGEDSFAGGGLADLAFRSGGDVLVAGGADVAAALWGALAGLRAPRDARRICAVGVAGRQRPRAARAVRGGAKITVEWSDQAQQPTGKTSAVAAVALGVALDDPTLHDPGRAALTPADCERLALEEGVLSRWTDLVLVAEPEADDAGHGDDEGPVLPQLRAALPRPFAVRPPARAATAPSREAEETAKKAASDWVQSALEWALESEGLPSPRMGLVRAAERKTDDAGQGDDGGRSGDFPWTLRVALPRPFAVRPPARAAAAPSREVEGTAEEPARPELSPLSARKGGSPGDAPVVGVSVKVDLRGGLATVAMTRTFRNPEGAPIEALLTFPAPPSARVFRLEARFAGRTARARALARREAEDAYEGAIADGLPVVRLEEKQRGLHVLSLGGMEPGAEIAVTGVWAVALELDGGTGRLRIPMTIAEVSGDSGLEEVFEPRAEAPPGEAPVVIESGSGPVRIGSKVVIRGPGGGTFTGSVPDNAPLDLVVEGLRGGNLTVRAADGRTVSVEIAPATGSDPIDAAVVLDGSASMDASCGRGSRRSKWEVAKGALGTVVAGLGKGDSVEFWAFADRLASRPVAAPDGLGRLGVHGAGKEIAAALRGVSERTGRADILLVTDGRRHVRTADLAGLGRRLFVVLVGEDSFAGGGLADLAVRSGGDVLVAGGEDAAAALRGALAGMRAPRGARRIRAVVQAGRRPRVVTAVRGGAAITAEWSGRAQESTGKTSAVAALALGLVLDDPGLNDPGRAALNSADGERLALEEGVLSPWTEFGASGGAQDGRRRNRG